MNADGEVDHGTNDCTRAAAVARAPAGERVRPDVMFAVLGVVGAVLLFSTLVFDDVIDDLIPGLDFISGPVIGAFVAAFGLVGWYADRGTSVPIAIAILGAAAGGLLFGAGTFRLTRSLMRQPTDATPTTASLVGRSGRVVTPIRAGGLGEVLVPLGGTSSKYTATADSDIALGAQVMVMAVESPTKVRVEAEAQLWS